MIRHDDPGDAMHRPAELDDRDRRAPVQPPPDAVRLWREIEALLVPCQMPPREPR